MDEPLSPPDAKAVVRQGYDVVSHIYRADDERPPPYAAWTPALVQRLPPGARVLDIGCGCGVPIARDLTRAGLAVTGVDISDVQITRARELVPGATFIRSDITTMSFATRSFHAIVALYSIIHVPLEEQPRLLRSIRRWLHPGGWLLLTAGQRSWTGCEEHWLGGDAAMWWSHTDAATYHTWLTAARLTVVSQEIVPEPGGVGHALFWAQRPA